MKHRAYKFRFYPTDEQAKLLAQTFGCVRFVYNTILRWRTDAYYQSKTKIGYIQASAKLTHKLDWFQPLIISILENTPKNLNSSPKEMIGSMVDSLIGSASQKRVHSKSQNWEYYRFRNDTNIGYITIPHLFWKC